MNTIFSKTKYFIPEKMSQKGDKSLLDLIWIFFYKSLKNYVFLVLIKMGNFTFTIFEVTLLLLKKGAPSKDNESVNGKKKFTFQIS